MTPSSILNKSLEELEGAHCGEPQGNSHLVQTVHRLRRVPLREFGAEDLRVMIGQNIGLRFLVPLAIDRLQKHPLQEGDFYKGDLLAAVLRADPKFWSENAKMRADVQDLAKRTIENLRERGHKKRHKFALTLETLAKTYDDFNSTTV